MPMLSINKSVFTIMLSMFLCMGCTTMTPLTKAIHDCDTNTMRSLIERGANIREQNTGSYIASPLHWALSSCDDEKSYEMVKILIDKGADINARDNYERTPLLVAAYKRKLKSSLYLIEKGAMINIKDKNGDDPLMLATGNYENSKSSELIKVLIDKGANINTSNVEGLTPLMNIAMFGGVSSVKYLIDKNADLFAYDYYGRTALDHAISYRKYDNEKLLKEAFVATGIVIDKDSQSSSEIKLQQTYDTIIFKKFELPYSESDYELDFPNAIATIENTAIAYLKEKGGVFKKVAKDYSEIKYEGKTLIVKPKIVSLRIPNIAQRIAFGFMAGKSNAVVLLRLIDGHTGKLMRIEKLSTNNNQFVGALTYGKTDRSIPSDMGIIIGAYLISVAGGK